MRKANHRTKLDRFSEHRQHILDALNVQEEFQALGLRLKGEPNSDGWIQCHAFDREDKNPSAAVNVQTGRYVDHGQGGMSGSIFDVWMKQNSGSFADAVKHYEQKTGLALPVRKNDPNKGVQFKDIGDNEKLWLVKNKPPITREGFEAVGGVKMFVHNVTGDVAGIPIFGSEVNDVPTIGWVYSCWLRGRSHGNKYLMTKGSAAGMMGLHGLQLIQDKKAEIVFVTEGVTDMIALQSVIPKEKWDSVAVVTHSNGAGEHPDTWKMQFFVGQKVVVIPDADKPGMDGGKNWANAIAKVAESVRFVPLYTVITEKHGKDLRDWLNEGNTFIDLERRVESTAPLVKADTQYTPEFCEKMLVDLDVNILGQDEERRIYGFSNHTMRRFVIKDRNRYTHLDLIGDCGSVMDKHVVPTKSDEVIPGKYTFKQVIEVFVRAASQNNIYDHDLCGQGIWLDPQTQHAVIMLGGGQAAVWNGITLARLTKPCYGDLHLNFQAAHSAFVDFDPLKAALENYDEDKAPAAFAELKSLLMQWNWQTRTTPDKDILVTLIAALAAASFIQSTFKFRPLVCVTGVSNSGKSDLQEDLLGVLFGQLSKLRQKPTEAALRQLAECNSNIIQIDELEQDKNRKRILELLRTSTDGGIVSRGQPNGKELRFGMKHIVWISSIEMNLANLADASRFFQFEPKRPEHKDGKRPLLKLDPQMIKRIGFDLMVFAIKNMQPLLETVKILSEADIENASPRNIEAAAVPAAFAEKLCRWKRNETHCAMYLWIDANRNQKVEEVAECHSELLQTILFRPIRVTEIGELSVAQTIKRAAGIGYTTGTIYAKEALERNGIKIQKFDEGGIKVFFAFAPMKTSPLLKGTVWETMDIGGLLKRLDFGHISTARLCGKQPTRGIWIPLEEIVDLDN